MYSTGRKVCALL